MLEILCACLRSHQFLIQYIKEIALMLNVNSDLFFLTMVDACYIFFLWYIWYHRPQEKIFLNNKCLLKQ